MAFSPDGRLVATGDFIGNGQLWSTETWKPVGRPLESHEGRIITLRERMPARLARRPALEHVRAGAAHPLRDLGPAQLLGVQRQMHAVELRQRPV